MDGSRIGKLPLTIIGGYCIDLHFKVSVFNETEELG